jgi:putative ABC transport system ATP-binding protein
MNVLVRAENVTKTYGEGALATPVLHGVSLEIRAGELTLLMGPSGSGKTSLISILAGLLPPSSGKVELCGTLISNLKDADVARVRRDGVGFVFQAYNLFPALTALENVAEVLRMKGMSRADAHRTASRALENVGLSDRAHHRPGELSGGQKQRVAIARAIAHAPPLLVGDEVTSALDGTSAMRVLEILRAHVGPSSGALIVTHDHRLERLADRVIELEDGRIVSDRTTARASGSFRATNEPRMGAMLS